jgi:hypothetical protein
MKSLRWGALTAAAIGLCLPATALAGTSSSTRTSNEVCGEVSVSLGSTVVRSPIPPACTRECFIVLGPVNVRQGGLGATVAPCVEG